MYKRHMEERLFQALEYMPVILLRGARQTGKTTLVKTIRERKSEYNYLSFDNLATLIAAQEDPAGFISSIKKFLSFNI